MGMFNYVAYEAPCRNCGFPMTGWQTKSSDQDLTMAIVEPEDCEDFYQSCPHCEKWNQYKVTRVVKILDAKIEPDEQQEAHWERSQEVLKAMKRGEDA